MVYLRNMIVLHHLDRAFKISSSYIIFHDELNKIKLLLQKNLYPLHVID